MKPVCVKCQVELRVKQVGARTEEMMTGDLPYRIWSCDVMECPTCELQVIVRFPSEPISEHFMPGYAEERKKVVLRYWPTIKDMPDE